MIMRKPEDVIMARGRLVVSAIVGLLVGLLINWLGGKVTYALLAAWDSLAAVYVLSVLATVLRFDATDTRTHARRENPGRTVADMLLLVTSVASLAAIGVLVFQASRATGLTKVTDIALGLFSVIVSWSVVHSLFMLRYARIYYSEPEGGINFNEKSQPRYLDFAYLAFTVGMTFQVSDTILETKAARAAVLRHALLSYLFGTVVIASAINTLVSLSS